MDPKLFLALFAGKVISIILKIKGSGATAAPGLYALNLDENLVQKLSKNNNFKSLVISGTNGKTTTSRLIYEVLNTDHKIIHNRAGSNLLRGIASTLIKNSSLFGKIDADLAIWEADEAALLPISKNLKIDSLVLLNLFRDQLDRYGEIDMTRKKWIEIVSNLPKTSTLILNSDDPSTNYLEKYAKCKVLFFGLETEKINLPSIENVADVKYCINCSRKLNYKILFSAHLGKYSCTNCTFKRNNPQIKATSIVFMDNFQSAVDCQSSIDDSRLSLNLPLPGLYNVYNALAAITAVKSFNVPQSNIKNAIENFSAAFGRFQKIKMNGCQITTFLIKNPAGANEVIRTIATKPKINLLLALNDNIADGRDVSWIWDTNWEALKAKISNLYISGTRSYDLALRLKYAGIKMDEKKIIPDLSKSLEIATKENNELIVLPTYTAMLELQNSFGGKKWHNQ